MLSRPSFYIFLIISVLAILIGIVLVIFIQFDRGYIATDTDENFKQLQKQIVEHSFQKNLENNQPAEKKETVKQLIEQVKQDDLASSLVQSGQQQTSTEKEIERIKTLNQRDYREPYRMPAYSDRGYAYEDYESYWLRNNPWSPYYQPDQH
jgi:predicted Holliday junction resolvase-like endonuclease